MKVGMNVMSMCHGTNTVVAVAKSSEKDIVLLKTGKIILNFQIL
jgi:hypothetical protein